MENNISQYRFKINDRLRRFLGINLKRKKVFIYTIKENTYISTDTVPANLKYTILIAQPSRYFWELDIPTNLIPFEPSSYVVINAPGHTIKLKK